MFVLIIKSSRILNFLAKINKTSLKKVVGTFTPTTNDEYFLFFHVKVKKYIVWVEIGDDRDDLHHVYQGCCFCAFVDLTHNEFLCILIFDI